MQRRIQELRAELNYHNHKYYVENSPEISDYEFDTMMRELQEKLRQQYPNGYTESMIRIDKGQGNFFYAVVLETEDINYLVKVDIYENKHCI